MFVIKIKHLFIIICSTLSILLMESCYKKPEFSNDSDFKLSFSVDTVSFDTIFTTMGSTTKQLKVYNRSKSPVKISSIRLAGGTASPFRINVDGYAALNINNVEINAKDSMYIFVKVTINPNNADNPIQWLDSIVFITNGNSQSVTLNAWGQDGIYHFPTNTNYPVDNGADTLYVPYSFADCSSPWIKGKPHVVKGYLIIPEGQTLTIEAGANICFTNNSGIIVPKNASLKVSGTLNNTVNFQGVRNDANYINNYKELPGQWDRIWIMKGSTNNEIDYALIKNGDIGIEVDSAVANFNTLVIKNTIIRNMNSNCILAKNSNIHAENLVASNTGDAVLAITNGGYYEFYQCTFANYWTTNSSNSFRNAPALVINNYNHNYAENNSIQVNPLYKANFYNCIVYGSLYDEIYLDEAENSTFNYYFDHCVLRTQKNVGNSNFFMNCIANKDPKFKDTKNNDYSLTEGSSAEKSGASANITTSDITGHPWALPQPSSGAYQYAAPN